jgi:hypothetical protein
MASTEEERKKRREYMRVWNSKNREKVRETNRAKHAKNKVRNNAYSKAWRDNARRTILYHYSGGDIKCVCCNEREYEFLAIDHINNDGAAHRKEVNVKGGIDMYVWIMKNEFPPMFQILCHNCNWSKRHPSGQCIHKRTEVT